MRRDPQTERGEQRREQILRCALRLFADQGIAGTGLRQIAQEVGIAQPALYHYFASKEALIDAIIEWRAHLMAERFPPGTFHPPEHQTLRQGLLDYLHHFHGNWSDPDNEAIHRVMLAELAQQSPLAKRLMTEFIGPHLQRLESLFAKLVSEGKIRDLEPQMLALQFVGPLVLMMLTASTEPSSRALLQQRVFQHLEVFIRGVERA